MKTIKLLLTLSIIFSCSMSLFAKEVIRLTNGEWEPFLSQYLPHYGMASHIVTDAFALVDVEVEYGWFPWKRAFQLAKKGKKWDGSVVWGKNAERVKDFWYPKEGVYDALGNVFFHRKDMKFDWNTIDDLKKYKIGLTSQYAYLGLKEFIEPNKLQVQWVKSDEINFKKLSKGRIDLFPAGPVEGMEQLRNTLSPEKADLITYHQNSINKSVPMYIIFSQNVEKNKRLMILWNKGIRLLKESGRYQQYLDDVIKGKYKGKKEKLNKK